ncbi:hypothetical protein [Streptomyces sparsus]
MAPTARAARLTAAAAALALGLTACGDSSSGDSTSAAGTDASSLVQQANKAMKETSFRSTGSTTAFANGTQETTWDPEKGLRAVASGDADGEMYCKDGRNLLSAGLLVASLEQSGQNVELPDELADVYVETETGQGCDALFSIPETAERAPEKDTEVEGTKTLALTAGDGRTEDVYYVAASGERVLLKMESARDGRRSSTSYGSFGEPTDVTLPPADRTMPMSDFQQQVNR